MTTRAQTPDEAPILIGLGANLPSPVGGPRETCEAALAALSRAGVAIARRSRWYRSAPVDRKSTRLNSSHTDIFRMPSSA